MVKLSRKAWNNVIIFSMLILIFLFNSTSNFLTGGADSEQPAGLIPTGGVIASLEFDNVKVERIGQGWRALGIKASENQLIKLNQAWIEARLDAAETELSISQATDSRRVVVNLVGQQVPLKFEIFQVADKTLVLSQQRLYQLTNTAFSRLFIDSDNDA